MFAMAQHQRFIRMLVGSFAHAMQKSGIDTRDVTRQNQQMGMASSPQTRTNTGQGAREVAFVVVHQLIGIRSVLFQVSIAGDDQVIAQQPGFAMQVRNQRLAVPFQQPFVLTAHALASATCQEQNGAGR
jgi:hypothetical protein